MNYKKGQHLRTVREYMALSRPAFANWLNDLGVQGRESKDDGDKKYSVKSIEAWETGKRNAPPKVLRAIIDNVEYEGEKISWSYLTGESDYITYGPKGIVHGTFSSLNTLNNSNVKWTAVNVEEIANSPDNKFAVVLYENILPYLGYNRSDIIDPARFFKYIKRKLKENIEDYIEITNNDYL